MFLILGKSNIFSSVKTYNSAGASLNGLIGDTSRNESRDDETYEVSKSASVVAPTHDLNQIEEEERFDPYQKEPDITKPSSVDTGLNEMNENRLKRQKGMRRKKTRSSQYIDQDELEPLHIPVKQAEVPVEPSVVVLRAKGSKFGEQNTDTSNSCTITNDQCRSDPERLSVSDNKLQVGELTENLKRTHGRRNMNTTLKSVLSESSVVDPDSQRRIHDGPKSAENVNEDHPASNLRRKNNQESVDIEQKDEIDQMFENICSQSNKWESDIAEFQQNAQEEDSWRTISADTTPFSSSQASRGREHTREQAQLILQHFLGLQSLRNVPNSETEQLVRDVMRIQSESRREQSARQELPSTSSFDLRPEPGTSRTRSFSSASNTAELIQSIHIDGRSQQTNTANLSQSICRSSRPMSGNSGNEEASSRNCQKWPGFAESYPQAVFPYYEIGASKMRLYYTPRQLNELMHEAKSLTEVFVSCFTAAVVAALTSLTGNSLRPLPIFGGAENSPLFGGISYLLLFFIGASAQYSVIKAPVPDTGKD